MATKNGRVALITGANKGLGKEIGRQLGTLGYTVVLTARDEQAGRAAAAELAAAGCDAHTIRLEVTSPDDIGRLAGYLESTFGRLDVLVNNAGIAIEWEGQPTDADKVRRTLEVNLIAPFAITEALVPMLSRRPSSRSWRATMRGSSTIHPCSVRSAPRRACGSRSGASWPWGTPPRRPGSTC
jgi:NAD(P)-dependent dehydrogenase (short-subunit alcohol dehydrogenase family)